MYEAAKRLGEAERMAREHARAAKSAAQNTFPARFPPGMEWEIVIADAVVLAGLTHALNESYAGYLQAMFVL